MKAQAFNANMNRMSIKDGMPSFRLSVLAEPTQEELYNLTQLAQKELSVVMQPLEGSSETLKMKNSSDLKSPSQRMRGVIYILYTQENTDDDFETYYKKTMEKLIDYLKSKIEE